MCKSLSQSIHSVYLQVCWVATPFRDNQKKIQRKRLLYDGFTKKYCRDVDAGIYKNIYQCLVVLDPYKELFISKVCLYVTDPIKMYVVIKAVSIHLKINIIRKSKNAWQKLRIGGKRRDNQH